MRIPKQLETLDVSNNNVNVELASIGNSKLDQMYADSTKIRDSRC